MKKLIRDKRTRAFLTAEGTWTADVREAREFTRDEAGSIRQKLRLRDCEIYYFFGTFEPTEYDFTIPL